MCNITPSASGFSGDCSATNWGWQSSDGVRIVSCHLSVQDFSQHFIFTSSAVIKENHMRGGYQRGWDFYENSCCSTVFTVHWSLSTQFSEAWCFSPPLTAEFSVVWCCENIVLFCIDTEVLRGGFITVISHNQVCIKGLWSMTSIIHNRTTLHEDLPWVTLNWPIWWKLSPADWWFSTAPRTVCTLVSQADSLLRLETQTPAS